MRRMGKKPGRPAAVPSSWLSQSSVLAKRLFTTRTRHTPPARASTLHSVAIGGEPPHPLDSPANLRGGSQAVVAPRDSMPGPKFIFTATGFPSFSSNSVGTNQDEIPGPVAMACQTYSGVPGTSTSTWMDRRPEASFLTLMTAPWDRVTAAVGALGGAALLGRWRTNDHRPAAGGRERHGIARDGLVDQARDRRTSERGRALHGNPSRLGGP